MSADRTAAPARPAAVGGGPVYMHVDRFIGTSASLRGSRGVGRPDSTRMAAGSGGRAARLDVSPGIHF